MEISQILGIIIAVIIFGAAVYFYTTPKSDLKVDIISKNLGGTINNPTLTADVRFLDSGTSGQVIITGNAYAARNIWNSLREGSDYTLECVNFFGSWNCDKIIQ